eukprot:199128_1
MSVRFEIRSFAGKGLGMVATKMFVRGEVILAEAPLLLVNPNSSVSLLSAMLGSTTQGAVLASDIRESFDALSEADKGRFLALDRGRDAKSGSNDASLTNLKNIIDVNSLACEGSSIAVYDQISRINHSCAANAGWYYHSERGEQVVVA